VYKIPHFVRNDHAIARNHSGVILSEAKNLKQITINIQKMKNLSKNLKNVAMIVACFAVCMMLAMTGCKKDDKKDDNGGGGGGGEPTEVEKLMEFQWQYSWSIWTGGIVYYHFEYYSFYKDGVFIHDYWATYAYWKYVGKYSVSDGKITFTEIKEYKTSIIEDGFVGKDGDMNIYNFVENRPNLITEYKFEKEGESTLLFIGSVNRQGDNGFVSLSDCNIFKSMKK